MLRRLPGYAPRLDNQYHQVGNGGEYLGIGHCQHGRRIDDDVVVTLAEGQDHFPHPLRAQKLGRIRRKHSRVNVVDAGVVGRADDAVKPYVAGE